MKFENYLNEQGFRKINYRRLAKTVSNDLGFEYEDAQRFIFELLTEMDFYDEAKKVNKFMDKIKG